MRSTVPFSRSRTNTSGAPFVSPDTRFAEYETNATNRPSALTAEACGSPSPAKPAAAPLVATLMSSVSPGAPVAATGHGRDGHE